MSGGDSGTRSRHHGVVGAALRALARGLAIVEPVTANADPVPVDPAALSSGADQDRERAVQCMTAAIAHEAGFEPLSGQQAVAEVILNRVRDPLFAKTVCGVVFAGSARRTGCQFTFACDGSIAVRLDQRVMTGARAVAIAALDGLNPVRVPGATHYHAAYVSPYWAPSLVRIGRIGLHIFYRLPAGNARGALAAAFSPRGEPLIAALTGQPSVPQAAVAPAALPIRAAPARFTPWGLPLANNGR